MQFFETEYCQGFRQKHNSFDIINLQKTWPEKK
jgi:hypothetical protein